MRKINLLCRFSFLVLAVMVSCKSSYEGVYCKIHGFAQGTTYNITYHVPDTIDYQGQVDSILNDFDMSLSSYKENSIISRINRNDSTVVTDEHFEKVFRKSAEVWKESDGFFDITVMPLVNAWGFGPGKKEHMDPHMIDSLLQFVGMEKVKLINHKIIKSDLRVQLDVNALAQGYSVDLVCNFFDSQGIDDYMVEIGGELRVKGQNPSGDDWKVGIDRPEFGNMIPGEKLQAILKLTNKSLATSGNYRKYYEENGVKYTHSLNPKTGYPANQNILSATILADDCMTADAYATVCMVTGLEKSKEMLKKHTELEGYLIYGDENGLYQVYATKGMKPLIAV
jgi:thiamine biosynthesis lipoprotein